MSDDEEEIEDKQVGDYILNDELGSGGFGKVVLGTHIPTGEKVAIKIMDKEQILSDELNTILNVTFSSSPGERQSFTSPEPTKALLSV